MDISKIAEELNINSMDTLVQIAIERVKILEAQIAKMYNEEEVFEIVEKIDALYRPVTKDNIKGFEYFDNNKK